MRDSETVAPSLFPDTSTIVEKIAVASTRIRTVIEQYKPIKTFGLFSGGHDSASACLVLARTIPDFEMVHINTGFGVEATRDYVRETCLSRGWPFRELKAAENCKADGTPDPKIYEDMVKKYGFPGPGWHGKMYIQLKERQLKRLERLYGTSGRGKNKRRVLYINGCRTQESKRRMATTDALRIESRSLWCAPLHDWAKSDTSACLEYFKQPRNIVVDLIHMSGECLCGAMADENREEELRALAAFDITRPAYERIMALEAIVKPLKGWGWGERPPRKQVCKSVPGQLCWSCMK